MTGTLKAMLIESQEPRTKSQEPRAKTKDKRTWNQEFFILNSSNFKLFNLFKYGTRNTEHGTLNAEQINKT